MPLPNSGAISFQQIRDEFNLSNNDTEVQAFNVVLGTDPNTPWSISNMYDTGLPVFLTNTVYSITSTSFRYYIEFTNHNIPIRGRMQIAPVSSQGFSHPDTQNSSWETIAKTDNYRWFDVLFSGLSPDTSYYYRYQYQYGLFLGQYIWTENTSTQTITTQIVLATPTWTGTALANRTNTSLTPQWNSVSGAEFYRIQRSTSSSMSPISATGTPTGTTHNFFSLSQNTQYYFRVRAETSSVVGDWSSVQSLTTADWGSYYGNLEPNISPAPGSISMQWRQVVNGTFYDWQIRNPQGFIYDAGTASHDYNFQRNHGMLKSVPSGSWYFRVRVTGPGGTGSWYSSGTVNVV